VRCFPEVGSLEFGKLFNVKEFSKWQYHNMPVTKVCLRMPYLSITEKKETVKQVEYFRRWLMDSENDAFRLFLGVFLEHGHEICGST
jgi:hypothetical protein